MFPFLSACLRIFWLLATLTAFAGTVSLLPPSLRALVMLAAARGKLWTTAAVQLATVTSSSSSSSYPSSFSPLSNAPRGNAVVRQSSSDEGDKSKTWTGKFLHRFRVGNHMLMHTATIPIYIIIHSQNNMHVYN